MADHKAVVDLKQCMNKAKDDAARAVCEATFVQAGGSVEGGKVFSAPDGKSRAFVSKGGKVF
jgi:hypothetical protein